MKKYIISGILLTLVGCSYDMQTYVDKPRTLLVDPLSVEHTKSLDALEESYLKKEISYDEYLKKKSTMEDDFVRDVQRRERRIEDAR